MGDQTETANAADSKFELCPEQITFSKAGPWKKRSRLEKVLIILCIVLFIAAVTFLTLFIVFKDQNNDTKAVSDAETCTTWDCLETASQVSQSIDRGIDPCDDFYQFACGRWMASNPLTPSQSSFNHFVRIHEDVQKALRDLLGKDDPNTLEALQKTRAFFKSCENTDAMDAKGVTPLLDLLKTGGSNLFPTLDPTWVDENLTLNQILTRVGKIGDLGTSLLIQMTIVTDMKQSNKNIILFTEPQLNLGSRDEYLGPRDSPELMLYQQLYVELMALLGANISTASQDAKDMVDFEILVANATMLPEEKLNLEKIYNKLTVHNLTQRFPQFDWLDYLQDHFSPEGITVTMEEEVVMENFDYYEKLFHAIESTPRRAVLNYCLWAFVLPFAEMLDSNAREMKDRLSRNMSGVSQSEERWKECVSLTDSLLYEASGRMYAEKHFSHRAKAQVEDMIDDLKDAFREMLQEADWMSEQTKAAALDKVNAIVNQVGFPDDIMNDTLLNEHFQSLHISDGEFFKNTIDISSWKRHQQLRKLRQPVDREEWTFSAAKVNAYYSPQTNSIDFPAGILHSPLYSDRFLDVMNYGGLGYVIGHELTHGFDNTGRAFDKEGNLRLWWQDEDLERFISRAECMVDQYSHFVEPVLNETINGKLTIGENIADNGGMKEAYMAYQKLIAKRGKKEPTLPVLNYTIDQLFFISTAQVWCGNINEQERYLKLNMDPHSPLRFRVIGAMQNNEEFSRAFNCPVGSYMNPEKKCHVW